MTTYRQDANTGQLYSSSSGGPDVTEFYNERGGELVETVPGRHEGRTLAEARGQSSNRPSERIEFITGGGPGGI